MMQWMKVLLLTSKPFQESVKRVWGEEYLKKAMEEARK